MGPMLDATTIAPKLKVYLLSQLSPQERADLQDIFVYPSTPTTLLFLGRSEQAILDFSRHVRAFLLGQHRRGEIRISDVIKSGQTSWTMPTKRGEMCCRGLKWRAVQPNPLTPREAAKQSMRGWVAHMLPRLAAGRT